MSINQWKLLNQLKDSLSKLSNDKSFQNVFKKDILETLQKLPSTFTVKDFTKYLTSSNQSETEPKVPLSAKKAQTEENKDNAPKWREISVMSNSTIFLQTQQMILAIESAKSNDVLQENLEMFIKYLKQHPAATNIALKMGGVRLFLRVRSRSSANTIQEPVREGLALLGYSDPVPRSGIRILSMDGGGIRGLLVLEMLKKLEELTGQKVHELFDLFCGVSTGAILSFSLGIHRRSLDDIARAYKDISKEVFKQSAILGAGNLMWTHAYYDTALWEKKLQQHLGCATLISTTRIHNCPKLIAVSAVVNQSHLSAYVFRNYSLPWRIKSQYFGSSSHEIWQAARASAAAPTYFEEFKLGNLLHQDGGILVNNPTAVALHEAKLIWPHTPVQCVISFGTGRIVSNPTEFFKESSEKDTSTSTSSWANKFYKILDSATDTEGVHVMLNDLLPPNVYYRFNPYLTEMLSMVEINPEKLEQLQRDAIMYLRRNEDKFQEAARALMQKKSLLQKTKDYIKFKRDYYGF